MRELKSIANRAFATFARRYLIGSMKTIGEIRRDNLLQLVADHGSLAQLNERLGRARTDATLSQVKNRSKDSKSGTPKAMGDDLARDIENKLGLDVGWMDNHHFPADHRGQRIEHAVAVMEQMDNWQFDQAVKILDTLAQPMPANGTTPPGG